MQWLDDLEVARGTTALAEQDGRNEVIVIEPNDKDGFRTPADKPWDTCCADPWIREPRCARDAEEEENEEDEDLDYLYEDEDEDLDDDLDDDLEDDLEDDLDDEDADEEDDDF